MPRHTPWLVFQLLLSSSAALLLQASPIEAQPFGRVLGRVVSEDGDPLSEATVLDLGTGRTTSSGASGAFALPVAAASSRIVVARLGFAAETLSVSTDADVLVRLRAAPLAIDPVVIGAERSASAASSRVMGALGVHLRPRESSQELLRLVPGLVIAQHAGGGKAEQIFMRGFDADHGTDVAVAVDGVPVNMVSHAHGQGYADLHFVLPEVIEAIDVRKGPYDAADGDFATAGAVELRTVERLTEAGVAVRVGDFGARRVFAGLPLGGGAGDAGGWLAGAVQESDGPFKAPQDHRRLNGHARWIAPIGVADLVLNASAFTARWDASGQIPERAVRNGTISRFGSLDPTEGGETSRIDASATLRSAPGSTASWRAIAFATRYDFDLFSNFTFFLNDPHNGDGIVQTDDRMLFGTRVDWSRDMIVAGLPTRFRVGAGTRSDRTRIELGRQIGRRLLGQSVSADISQDHGYAWAEHQLHLPSDLRLTLGMRVDGFRFEVTDRIEGGRADRTRAAVNPRVSLMWRAAAGTSLFANAGTSFHSNDARVVVSSQDEEVLPRALGSELGVRHTWSGGTLGLAAWLLDLESELVYVGDEGTTEISGATRRVGIDADARLRVRPWLWADVDVNIARGRFRDLPSGEDRIPLAPNLTSAGGLTVRDLGDWTAGVRYRLVGERAADEINSVRARGHTLIELFGTWTFGRLEASAVIDNLFDVEWNEAQFATTSRLRNEPAAVNELHFTPGSPRSLQLGVAYRLR